MCVYTDKAASIDVGVAADDAGDGGDNNNSANASYGRGPLKGGKIWEEREKRRQRHSFNMENDAEEDGDRVKVDDETLTPGGIGVDARLLLHQPAVLSLRTSRAAQALRLPLVGRGVPRLAPASEVHGVAQHAQGIAAT